MIEPPQLQKLIDILTIKDQSLEEIEKQFSTIFVGSISVFNASFAISNLLNHNLLSSRQRIVAIFLLILNFKSQGIKRHPFGLTIFNVSLTTQQPFQRHMIGDLVVDLNRQKYSKFKVEQLFDEEQSMSDRIDQRPQIKNLREQFIARLPRISQCKKSEAHSFISDSNKRDKHYFAPEIELNYSSIKGHQISHEGLNIGFMRPIPQFINISPSQLNWISPGIVSDVYWDNKTQIEKRLQRCRQLVNRGFDHNLTADQTTEIDHNLQIDPYAVIILSFIISREKISLLIKNNPSVALAFLTKISNYPLISQYLQSILHIHISFNSIEVLSRLIKVSKIPIEYLQAYTLKSLKEAISIPENHKERVRLPRIIAAFVLSLSKNKLFDPSKYFSELYDFIKAFFDIQEVQSLKEELQKYHQY